MNKNTYTVYDADGDYNDWLELYNPNAEAVDLSGFYLSDSETDFKKWQFPQGVQIPAGDICSSLRPARIKNGYGTAYKL